MVQKARWKSLGAGPKNSARESGEVPLQKNGKRCLTLEYYITAAAVLFMPCTQTCPKVPQKSFVFTGESVITHKIQLLQFSNNTLYTTHMRNVLKTLFAGFIVVGFSFALAACAPTPNGDNIKLSAIQPTSTPMVQAPTTPSASPSATANPTTTDQLSSSNDVQKGPPMKTLADFEKITAKEATINTNKGAITFTLFEDKVPLTVTNFLTLAKSGFYNGIKFHRIIADFMAQVGDPLTKDDSQKALWGTGGPGYAIADEFDPTLKHDSEGTVSMANSGPNTGGSQFFITFGPTPWLDGKHAVFGKVTSGMDVLRKLEIGDQILSVTYK